VSFAERWTYPHGDPSCKLWDYAVQAGWIDLPLGASVLELGCCETDWHKWMRQADPRLDLVGVDVNECPGYSGAFEREDAADWWPVCADGNVEQFDAVVLLGSLEHFGLGYYGDPSNETADAQAVSGAAHYLKPGGFLYYDVPWTPAEYYITANRHFRVYDDAALAERITPAGLTLERQAWAVGNPDPPPELISERPTEPMVPFWYCVRLLRKPLGGG
jgi:SAM-dependent methyltransferase